MHLLIDFQSKLENVHHFHISLERQKKGPYDNIFSIYLHIVPILHHRFSHWYLQIIWTMKLPISPYSYELSFICS